MTRVMTLTSIVEQQETMNPGAEPYGYQWRFNLLDMIGIGPDLSPVSPRLNKSGPPDEDRYGNRCLIGNWLAHADVNETA